MGKKILYYLLILLGVTSSFGLLSCKEKPENVFLVDRLPVLFPDYIDITIPINITPLNFRIDEAAEKCYVEVTGTKEGKIEIYGKNKVVFDRKKWEKLKKQNEGSALNVSVSVKKEGSWQTYTPFIIHIAESSIDSHLVYRLIEPGYEKWHIVGIYQRDLTSFEEKPIIKNDMTGYNCINCHSFCGGDPQQMMFHMRAVNDGTYILQNGTIDKIRTKTDQTISNMTYPYWHPSGNYIAASINDTKQLFHSVKEKKMEVFDLESDLVVYDIASKTILSSASLITSDAYETFPTFSPDGKWLYFCTAPAQKMPENYQNIRYHLCRVGFNAEKGEFVFPVDTLVYANEISCSMPRISPDGRFLMYTESDYGQFPIWHDEAEIQMIDLSSGDSIDMELLNSPDTESYHSWSSNSQWVVISSRRENGLYTLPYIVYIDEDGRPGKPFLLPQKDPDRYDFQLYSYNIPELVKGEVMVEPYYIQSVAEKEGAIQIGYK